MGGDDNGYPAKVIAQNDRELVLQKENGRFEIVARGNRDHTLFDSYEDGKRHRDERAADCERQKAEYEEKLAAKLKL